jgi:CheY-like chemotaxis protein
LPVPHPHLLIAEDDQDIREVVADVLADEGYRVSQSASSAEALAQVNAHLFQFILTDLFAESSSNPWKSVQPLLHAARPTPVGVFTSWNVSPEAIARHGFAFLLKKPFEFDDLLDAVANSLHPMLTPAQQQQAQIIQRLFSAFSQKDWSALHLLLTEDVTFYLLRPRNFAFPRAVLGRERVIAFAQGWLERVPGCQIEGFNVLRGKHDMGARFQWSMPMPDGNREKFIGSAILRFQGERVHQIGVTLNTWKLAELLRTDSPYL